MSGNVYTSNAAGISTTYWGPTVSLTKAMLGKTLRGSWASSYNETKTSSALISSPILNNRLSLTYSPKSKEAGGGTQHNFSLGVNALNRLKETEQQPAYTELTSTLNYTYTF